MGLGKPGETCGLMGMGPGLARQESAGRVSGRVWNRTDPFLRSKPGPLAGYPDPLLTLHQPQDGKKLCNGIKSYWENIEMLIVIDGTGSAHQDMMLPFWQIIWMSTN